MKTTQPETIINSDASTICTFSETWLAHLHAEVY